MQISCTKYYDLWGKKEEKVKATPKCILVMFKFKVRRKRSKNSNIMHKVLRFMVKKEKKLKKPQNAFLLCLNSKSVQNGLTDFSYFLL